MSVSGEISARDTRSLSEPAAGSGQEDSGPHTQHEALGKYHPIAALGSGGMSKVHLAVVRGPGGFHKLVVLKELHASLSNSDQYLPMFLDEARLAARLNHPNVVQTNEVGQAGDIYFIAMEYLDGQPLSSILRRTSAAGGLPLPFALRIVADVCAGLHHAHNLADFDGSPLHVVHRDVSPQNIFVTYDGQTKVVDFGVAKAAGRAVQTRVGVLKGKIRYMAPEQARAETVDRRADMFSLGVVLYEMVAVRRLWQGRDIDTLQELRAGRIPDSPKEFRPELPDAIDRICRRALSVLPEKRHATALDMQRELEDCLDSLTPRVTPRAIGELVSGLFGQERLQIHALIERQLRKLESIAAGSVSSPHLSIPTLTLGGAAITGSSPSRISAPPPSRWWTERRIASTVVGFLFAMLLGVSWALWHFPPKTAASPEIRPAVDIAPVYGATAPLASSSTAPPAVEPPAARATKPRPVQPLPTSVPVPMWSAGRKITVEPNAPPASAPPPRAPVAPTHAEEDPLGDRK
jgi:eukaryotic-like serine/threonine-protein kinase